MNINLGIMSRTVEFYRTEDGKCPVEEFLDSLSNKESQKVLWVLRLIERLDRVPSKYFKKLVNTDEIWECRVSTHAGIDRLFSFFFQGNRLIVTHGYSKKTQKTNPREIRRAEKYRQEFLIRHKERRK